MAEVLGECERLTQGGASAIEAMKPLNQWLALHELERLRVGFLEGSKAAMLEAVSLCAWHDLMMPDWLARGFLNAYRSVTLNYEAATWDAVFGAPNVGVHLEDARRRRRLGPQVWLAVNKLRQEGRATDDLLFEDVGDQVGVKKSLAKQLYYAFQKKVDRSLRDPVMQALLAPHVRKAPQDQRPPKTRNSRKFPRKPQN